ncbi:DUF3870 domain-containing protein [Brevibacillus sp. SYSU BS000544]|uniref:DUF3870 domain-containing protein n=1 Tax=Brevibacillus sp. SYSU BS000544 TaxID=3416443 RepID=UPI003CE4747A
MYDDDTLYVVGDAQASTKNPITQQYSSFFVGLVIDATNDKIVEAGCSATIPLTSDFVRSIFVGRKIWDTDEVTVALRRRYFGDSQKALIVAFKDAQKKYKLALKTREENFPQPQPQPKK